MQNCVTNLNNNWRRCKLFYQLQTLATVVHVSDVSIAFLESTSVLPFLHECLTTDQLPSAVLAFVLKLCARLGGGRGYVSLGGNSLLGRLLQMARSSDQWTHPSVRCALFLMLRSMCENEAGVDWLLEKGTCMSADILHVHVSGMASPNVCVICGAVVAMVYRDHNGLHR